MKPAAALLVPAIFALSFAARPVSAQAGDRQLTVESIYLHGPVVGNPPEQLTWSPDGKRLTYIDSGELIELDPETGKSRILVSRSKMSSLTQTDGSEQDLDRRRRYNMGSYFWAPDSKHVLFDSDGRLWYYDLKTGTGVQVGNSNSASGDDPKFSPDGHSISFIRKHGLAVINMRDPGAPTTMIAAAPPASDGQDLLNGGVDWVYEEELDTRSNYFWSPDSKAIAYLQMNETNVPRYPITDWIPVHATVEMQRYPQPGDDNPEVHVGVVSAHGGKTGWMKLPVRPGNDYIPRFGWVNDKTLWVEVLTRDQKHRTIYFADIYSGDSRPMLEISDDKFLDDNYDVQVGGGFIVLTNWTSGHNQIYLYSYDEDHPDREPAKLVKQLTHGDFEVDAVYRVDNKAKVVDYASNRGDQLQQQLWQVNFAGESKQISSGAGFHDGDFAPEGTAYTDKQSTRMNPPTLSLCAEPGHCHVFWQTHALEAYHLRVPTQLEAKAVDGTPLYATLLLPKSSAEHSVPLIVNPYGGPGPQEVADRWDASLLFDEVLAEHGFAVLHADNRGTGSRGRAFAQLAYHDFGPIQFKDQLTVIDAALAQYPQLDPKRLGWWGWSWGGSFTLYAMTHSDRFRAGVAVAPVTDWRNYDSIYTERYLGKPMDDAQAYHDDSVVNSAAGLKGHLLIAHGTGDDNVHIGNTVQFIQQLIEARLPYELQIFPRKTHSIYGPDVRTDLFDRILAHFEKYLAPAAE